MAIAQSVPAAAGAVFQPDGGDADDLFRDPADAPGRDSINVANGQDRRAAADSHSKTNFFIRQIKTR